LIEGEIFTMGRGGRRHEIVKANANAILVGFALTNREFLVFPESMYRMSQSELQPDVGLVRRDRLTAESTAGLMTGAPDLAVEIVSSEPAALLERKVRLYLTHGSHAVWAVFPEEQLVRRYDRSGASQRFEAGQTMSEPELMPGFVVSVGEFFEEV
jgi:Uma2 family endonuclease